MKRIWIALAILMAIFASTMWHSAYIRSFTKDLTFLLEAAEGEAESGNWSGATDLTAVAREKWEKKDPYLHITLRHNETDAIYAGFREVNEFLQCMESGEYSAANARLIANLELLSEAEQLTLKNIL